MIVDLNGIEAHEGRAGNRAERMSARVRASSSRIRGTGDLGEDGEKTRRGGWFEDAIGRCRRSYRDGGQSERDRG